MEVSDQRKEDLPHYAVALTFGILSIVLAGGLGTIFAVTCLRIQSEQIELYLKNPGKYNLSSYFVTVAARICGIIGLGISALVLTIIFAYLNIIVFVITNIFRNV